MEAINSRVGEGNFTVYQFIFGRDPKIQTSFPFGSTKRCSAKRTRSVSRELRHTAEIAAAETDASIKLRLVFCIEYDLFLDPGSHDNFVFCGASKAHKAEAS